MDVVITTMNRSSAKTVCAYYLSSGFFSSNKIIVVDFSPQSPASCALKKLSLSFENILYFPVEGRTYFNKSLALNLGVSLSKSPQFLFCDADVMVTSSTLNQLAQRTRSGEAFMIENVVETEDASVRAGPGIISVARSDFLRVGGYNSALTGWGYEDRDFIERLNLSGCTVSALGSAFHMSHSNALRVQNYDNKDRRSSRENNYRASQLMQRGDLRGSYASDVGQKTCV